MALFQQPRDCSGLLSEASISAQGCFVGEYAERRQCKQADSCGAACAGSSVRKSAMRKRRQVHDAHCPFSSIKRQKTIKLFLHVTLLCKNLL